MVMLEWNIDEFGVYTPPPLRLMGMALSICSISSAARAKRLKETAPVRKALINWMRRQDASVNWFHMVTLMISRHQHAAIWYFRSFYHCYLPHSLNYSKKKKKQFELNPQSKSFQFVMIKSNIHDNAMLSDLFAYLIIYTNYSFIVCSTVKPKL